MQREQCRPTRKAVRSTKWECADDFGAFPGHGSAGLHRIVGGEPTIDMSSLDPGRFGPGPIDDDELTSAGLWRYANYYTPQLAG